MATEAQRSLAAGIASLTNWSRIHGTDARRRATQPARDGRRRRLEQQVLDEAHAAGRELTQVELEAAVDALRRAHYKAMALASAKKRAQTA
jgi:hypothetical protein